MDAQQTQHRRQFRPSMERLESLQLLSGITHAIPVHPVASVHAEATKTPASVAVVNLLGTIHATVRESGSTVVIAGSGNLGAVGTASVNYHLSQTAPLPTSTLSTKKGKIELSADASTVLGGGSSATSTSPRTMVESFAYTVVGGTGAYAHATGSGTLTETVTLTKVDKFTISLAFS